MFISLEDTKFKRPNSFHSRRLNTRKEIRETKISKIQETKFKNSNSVQFRKPNTRDQIQETKQENKIKRPNSVQFRRPKSRDRIPGIKFGAIQETEFKRPNSRCQNKFSSREQFQETLFKRPNARDRIQFSSKDRTRDQNSDQTQCADFGGNLNWIKNCRYFSPVGARPAVLVTSPDLDQRWTEHTPERMPHWSTLHAQPALAVLLCTK